MCSDIKVKLLWDVWLIGQHVMSSKGLKFGILAGKIKKKFGDTENREVKSRKLRRWGS